VSAQDRIGSGKKNRGWASRHHISTLRSAIEELDRKVDGRPVLPRSQQHTLRSALFDGRDIADTRLALIEKRYDLTWSAFGEPLGDHQASLFFRDEIDESGGKRKTRYCTRFLDALQLIDIGERLVP
jgi:hypothetical protein